MFDRFESMKKAIHDGHKDYTLVLADQHFLAGRITQAQFDELYEMAYPVEEEVVVNE